jgi:phospho-N-acetylmuramoyl-pentapeptide-transferase
MIALMIATAVSTLVSLFGTRYLIIFFRTRGQGQPILGKEDRGPEHHMMKQGTPTMGGIAIVGAAFIGWVAAHVRDLAFSNQTLIVWAGVLLLAAMGFLDDYIKVRKGHNRGIFWKQKNYITMLMSFAMAWLLVVATGISETISVTRPEIGIEVPTIVWVVWAGLIIWATTNAVNVTDGLDGLAAGSALMGFGAFALIGYWLFRNPDVYDMAVNPLDMGVFAAAFAGGALGFSGGMLRRPRFSWVTSVPSPLVPHSHSSR